MNENAELFTYGLRHAHHPPTSTSEHEARRAFARDRRDRRRRRLASRLRAAADRLEG